MNGEKFLKDLNIALDINKVSKETKKDIIDEFKEHISLAIKSGKDEKEVVDALGDPYEISKDYKRIDEELYGADKIKLSKMLQMIKDAIFHGIISLWKGYLIFICQIFILVMIVLGGAICILGAGCLLGLVSQTVNKVVLVGYDSVKVPRDTMMVCLGILCPIIGTVIFKLFLSINRKFRKSVYRGIEKKSFILKRYMRGEKIQ